MKLFFEYHLLNGRSYTMREPGCPPICRTAAHYRLNVLNSFSDVNIFIASLQYQLHVSPSLIKCNHVLYIFVHSVLSYSCPFWRFWIWKLYRWHHVFYPHTGWAITVLKVWLIITHFRLFNYIELSTEPSCLKFGNCPLFVAKRKT